MATPNLDLTINDKNEIIRKARGRESSIARINNGTLVWKDELTQSTYRKSVDAVLHAEGIKIDTILLEGQSPDVLSPDAPPPPAQHKMQGEMTPAYLEWLMEFKPIAFQNLLGVQMKPLKAGEKPSKDPRENWLRADVVRSDTRPTDESRGGQYKTVRFKMKNQIIARRISTLTFSPKEIDRGTNSGAGDPYADPYKELHKDGVDRPGKYDLDGVGKVEVVSKKESAASAGSAF